MKGKVSIVIPKRTDGKENSYLEEQKEELEALRNIFSAEDLIIHSKDPYTFEILLNSFEDTDRNLIKLKLTFELPLKYPEVPPIIGFINLSPEFIDI
jgi:ubiquitin-protein ligase